MKIDIFGWTFFRKNYCLMEANHCLKAVHLSHNHLAKKVCNTSLLSCLFSVAILLAKRRMADLKLEIKLSFYSKSGGGNVKHGWVLVVQSIASAFISPFQKIL